MFSNITRSKIQFQKCRKVAPKFSPLLGGKLRKLEFDKTSKGIPGGHQEDETDEMGRKKGSGAPAKKGSGAPVKKGSAAPVKKVPLPNDVA